MLLLKDYFGIQAHSVDPYKAAAIGRVGSVSTLFDKRRFKRDEQATYRRGPFVEIRSRRQLAE